MASPKSVNDLVGITIPRTVPAVVTIDNKGDILQPMNHYQPSRVFTGGLETDGMYLPNNFFFSLIVSSVVIHSDP
jgi:hypothetical protein